LGIHLTMPASGADLALARGQISLDEPRQSFGWCGVQASDFRRYRKLPTADNGSIVAPTGTLTTQLEFREI
jgi:hypothetical protein